MYVRWIKIVPYKEKPAMTMELDEIEFVVLKKNGNLGINLLLLAGPGPYKTFVRRIIIVL